ncbi:TrkH family potassium uptake protein [Paracoccus sp. (in: a-proteobacteria)]|uniref:TrkH family potassium uptake protein n=1 Tax=Paracoccus sp. TaxID=267 RepID=UPI0026E05A8E|nr:potassium transporter TrkG [Paracoccus sp. (in: a-proteobacteria)]MDO5647824.1 potassium transporter TrkG [Paracoccus sp. (in: a-proteobacteria)]
MRVLIRLPVLVILMGLSGVAMLVPAVFAQITGDAGLARIFSASAGLVMVGAVLMGLAFAGRGDRSTRDSLLSVVVTFAALPLVLALPWVLSVPDTGWFNAWWEMVSSLTTTGATLYSADLIAPPLHLWRALVGWLGGLFVLSAAVAILAPLRLGGFEIMDTPDPRPNAAARRPHLEPQGRPHPPNHRLGRAVVMVLPVYGGLTLALWVGLSLAGDTSFVALCRAMGTLSTSGIAPAMAPVTSGIVGEVLIALFLIPALSRRFWPGSVRLRASERLRDDPELRLAAGLVLLTACALFLRHFWAAIDGGTGTAILSALRAFWGGLFNAISFLTTTGWNSIEWQGMRAWSGLTAPGLVLAGLAMMGGGVATTAGGVKLLRVYALSRHGARELERVTHPNSVGGGGEMARRLAGPGAYLAFIFFMLFALTLAVVIAAVSIHPLEFETATVLSIAVLTNTGPLAGTIPLIPATDGTAGMASAPWQGWSGLPVMTKAVLAAAMIIGRVETLAVLALMSPEFWRRR